MNFVKFLRTPFLRNTSGRLLSYNLDLLDFYICICFGRYLEGIPVLHKTELQTRVMHDLVLYRKSIQCLLFSNFDVKFGLCSIVEFLML